MKKHTLVILIWAALIAPITAQDTKPTPEYRQYATQTRLRQLLAVSGVTDSMAAIERFATDFRHTGHIDTITVAVVFHLMPLPNGAQSPSAADIQAQLDRLTTDFFSPEHPYLAESYQHPDALVDSFGNVTGTEADYQTYLHEADVKEHFAERAGRPLIRFCLAAMGPDGLPANGIVQPTGAPRIWSIGDSICFSEFGGSNAWNPVRYCNIRVARLAGSVAGYAQMPGGPGGTDGVVIDDRFFAREQADTSNHYRLGRTLTHLLGGYLNLYELWNESYACGDDYVDDTPIHNAPNYGLPDYRYRHVSTCDGNPVEMLSNLMDNTDDAKQYLFTWGQIIRMQATLAEGGPRSFLRRTPTACTTGVSMDRQEKLAKITFLSRNTLNLRVYPNPTTGRFQIEIQSGTEALAEIRIHNALGGLIYQQSESINSGITRREVDATNWSQGVYIVYVLAGKEMASQKVFVQK